MQVTAKISSWTGSLGKFLDALYYSNQSANLILESGTLVRGIGLVDSNATMLTGSSGGFTQSRTLVEAWLAGGIQLPAPVPSVQLGIESLV